MKGNIVVGQSGGPTAVINSSVAGVYAAAKKLGVKKVYGMVHGIQGFLQDNLCDLDEYLADETGIELLKRTPSAYGEDAVRLCGGSQQAPEIYGSS